MHIRGELIFMFSILLMQMYFAPATSTKKDNTSVAKKGNSGTNKKVVTATPANKANKVKTNADTKAKNPKKATAAKKPKKVATKDAKKKSPKNSSTNKTKTYAKTKGNSTKNAKGTRIINGNVNTIANFPYMCQIYRDKTFICGGTLVSRRFVVTAAHCVPSKPVRLSRLSVKLGASKLSDAGVKRKVSKVMKPTAFSMSTMHKDVAVFKLAFAAVGPNIKPISLNTETIKPGMVAKTSGWGTRSETGNVSNRLRVIKVPVLSKETCTADYQNIIPITNTMFCAAKSNRDHCYGDSGGPAVIRDKLAGIVSFANGCARTGYPGVYTGVYSVLSFIKKAMKQ